MSKMMVEAVHAAEAGVDAEVTVKLSDAEFVPPGPVAVQTHVVVPAH